MTSPKPTRIIGLCAATAALGLSACGGADGPPAANAPATVRISTGAVRGTTDAGSRRFLGIRYAQAPTGQRRFRAPAPAPKRSGVQDATRAGAACPQTAAEPLSAGRTSEDCLFLNVTTPRRRSTKPRPVMFWIHGGGGTSGSGAAYDARRLAEQGDVVVVTPNYRLGSLGLLALPGLKGGGTFALADQLAALRWTKRNAAAFGGDPRNITVFGESQGGFSTCGLLTTPAAKGLFQRASMSSGNCSIRFPRNGFAPGVPALRTFLDRRSAQVAGTATAKALGCAGRTTLACLRRAPVKRLLQVPTVSFAYGTPLLPRDPEVALRQGRFHRVPVIVGTNADEAAGVVGAAPQGAKMTRAGYAKLLRQAFGARAAAVLAEYPLRDGDLPAQRFAQVMTDAAWTCPTRTTQALLAKHVPTYAYEFDDPDAPNVAGIHVNGYDPGVGHASDLPSLFDLGGRSLLRTAGQRALGAEMVGYWSRFARTGDPNGAGAPAWARFTGGDVQRLAPGAAAPVDTVAEHRCGFWTRTLGA